MNRYFLIPLILLCTSCTKRKQANNIESTQPTETLSPEINHAWIFDKIEERKLLFKNNKGFDTKIYGLEYVGQIPVENKAPFLIFSGIDCMECDAEQALYIHSPDDGELLVEYGKNAYQFPGKLYDYETDSLLYEGRAFYGEVLKNKRGIIWYQKSLLDKDKGWKNSIFFVDLSSGMKKESFLEEKGQMEETIALFEKGLCKEIAAYDQHSMP